MKTLKLTLFSYAIFGAALYFNWNLAHALWWTVFAYLMWVMGWKDKPWLLIGYPWLSFSVGII